MAKKNEALEGYTVAKDTPHAGVEYGIEYNLDTVSAELIDIMIERGSKLFTKKQAPKKKE